MSTGQSNGKAEEQRLVKLYMDLTGTSESAARNVYMFVGPQEENSTKGSSTTTLPLESKRSQPKSPAATVIIFASLLISASVVGGHPFRNRPKTAHIRKPLPIIFCPLR